MFAVHCPICDRRLLLGVDELGQVHNLAPGVISVQARCPRGHSLLLLTGRDVVEPAPDRVPALWPAAYRRPERRLARLLAAFLRFTARQAALWARLHELPGDREGAAG